MATLDVLTLSEAKAALNLTGTTQYDEELPAWITGVSLALDSKVGPIVKRTITDEVHDGSDGHIYTNLYPVVSITSVKEYNNVTETVLTAETNVTKPASGYFAERYQNNPSLYSGLIRRSASGIAERYPLGSGNVVVTYVAGRFDDTVSVDERFKTAARLMLQNLWNSQRPSLGNVDEFEIPQQNWPRFAVPNAVREMLADEWQAAPSVA